MYIPLQPETYAPWLAPYAYGIVLLGFSLFFFRVFENWYASFYNKPLFRHYFVYKKLTSSQLQILKEEVSFYTQLSKKHKRQYEHRIAQFISEKKFIGRSNLEVNEQMILLISAMGCMLSFGRKNYNYGLVEYILVYPEEFYSTVNNNYHKGEFNPREKALVVSWKDFESGYKITDDNFNLGIHEFMHAMQLEASTSRDLDSIRFKKQFQNILKRLTQHEVKNKLAQTQYFRSYAFTNQFEFIAVLAEYFFESPREFKASFPELYGYTKTILNFNYAGY